MQGVRSEAVGHAASPHAGIAPGEDVHPRVAHDQSLLGRRDPFPAGWFARLLDRASWWGSCCRRRSEKEFAQPEGLDDRPRRDHRLVREHSHLARLSVAGFSMAASASRFPRTSGCDPVYVHDSKRGSIPGPSAPVSRHWLPAECAANQRRSAVPDVAGNHIVGQFGTLHMPQGGIDRVHQVEPRVDQGAVKVEDQQWN